MIKFFASFCIMLSSVLLGFEIKRNSKTRLDEMAYLCNALELLHGELSARPAHLDELCGELSVKCMGASKKFFSVLSERVACLGEYSFKDIWESAGKDCFPFLDKRQIDSLLKLGDFMGAYRLSEQLGAIRNCKDELEAELILARSHYEQSRKLFLAVPCSITAVVLVVLM